MYMRIYTYLLCTLIEMLCFSLSVSLSSLSSLTFLSLSLSLSTPEQNTTAMVDDACCCLCSRASTKPRYVGSISMEQLKCLMDQALPACLHIHVGLKPLQMFVAVSLFCIFVLDGSQARESLTTGNVVLRVGAALKRWDHE